VGPPDLCFASSDHTSAPEIATLKLRSARASISKTSPVDADRFSAEYAPLDSRAEGEKTHMSEEARETRGVHNPHVIDLISLDPEANEVVLLMLEERPWGTVPNQLEQLDDKYNSYISYVLDGHLAKQYPQYADKAVRIQLDCASPPGSREQVRINAMRNFADSERLRFRMSVIVAQDPS